jgi:hypothetical protein
MKSFWAVATILRSNYTCSSSYSSPPEHGPWPGFGVIGIIGVPVGVGVAVCTWPA